MPKRQKAGAAAANASRHGGIASPAAGVTGAAAKRITPLCRRASRREGRGGDAMQTEMEERIWLFNGAGWAL